MTSPPLNSDGAPPIVEAPVRPVRPVPPQPAIPPVAPPSRQLPERSDLASTAESLLDQAQQWMEQNQTVAMIGAFALGTFLGIWIRR